MKLIHLSDLHLGKRLKEHSLIEDQKDILLKILGIIDEEKADAVIIAGDVYDKQVAPVEAVELFDDLLTRLCRRGLPVFIISGNHDSPERLACGGRIMERNSIYISPVYNGSVEPITLHDEHGEVRFYLLPFIKPANVRKYFEEREISSYTDAAAAAVSGMGVDTSVRNVLVTHQYVTGAVRSESEDSSVGGSDNIDASVFADFDYVALGHIHRPQNVEGKRVRYCGTPLKYSFSEVGQDKSVTVVELGQKGKLDVREVPLTPLHETVSLRGSYEELMQRSSYEGTTLRDDYVRIILTDEEEIPDAAAKLRIIYRGLMVLEYDNTRTRLNENIAAADDVENRSPLELFSELYEQQNGLPLSPEQQQYMKSLIEKVWEGEI